MLAWGMLSFGGGYNKSDLWAKGQETLRWNTDYLLKTIKDDPVGTATLQKPQFYMVYQVFGYSSFELCAFCQLCLFCQALMPLMQAPSALVLLNTKQLSGLLQVGNQTLEKALWTRPENDTNPRPAYYVGTYNGSSDLAGQLSAAFAATAMVFQDSDPAYYQQLMNKSTLLYAAGIPRRAAYTHLSNYPCATNTASNSVVQAAKPVCLPGDEVFRGAMVATYNSTSIYDDLTWAAAWLNLATKDPAYLADAYRSVSCAFVVLHTVFRVCVQVAQAECSICEKQ